MKLWLSKNSEVPMRLDLLTADFFNTAQSLGYSYKEIENSPAKRLNARRKIFVSGLVFLRSE